MRVRQDSEFALITIVYILWIQHGKVMAVSDRHVEVLSALRRVLEKLHANK